MNNFFKTIATGLCSLLMFVGVAFAQPCSMSGATCPKHLACQGVADSLALHGCPHLSGSAVHCMEREPMTFEVNKSCYTPFGFVVVNETDNAIDLIVRDGDSLRRAGRYVVDEFKGRHDIKNILRPVSVKVSGCKAIFLATAADSSYIGVLCLSNQQTCMNDCCSASPRCSKACSKPAFDTLIAAVGFHAHADGFNICEAKGELMVVGYDPSGYSINIIDISEGLCAINNSSICESLYYHVPKQSERIQQSDPVGVGLTVVAVLVVFFALVCIAVILNLFGKSITKFQNRSANKAAGNNVVVKTEDTAGDVYAAIAAALYMYDEELHDEEDTIITIQKVERSWTPWNAKYYNMNHFFNNRK
ncbi:MAG: OadG family protein [Bacteroidales bacterium]|nr:OadG family protein [Candidatus Colimorpha onthohippi]